MGRLVMGRQAFEGVGRFVRGRQVCEGVSL